MRRGARRAERAGSKNINRQKMAQVEMQHSIKVDYLRMILANTVTLMMKIQVYCGEFGTSGFLQMKKTAERQYPELFKASDLLLERIHSLDIGFNYSLTELKRFNRLMDPLKTKDSLKKLNEMKEDHLWMTELIKKALHRYALEKDRETTRLLLQRLDAHEKSVWELEKSISGIEENEKSGINKIFQK